MNTSIFAHWTMADMSALMETLMAVHGEDRGDCFVSDDEDQPADCARHRRGHPVLHDELDAAQHMQQTADSPTNVHAIMESRVNFDFSGMCVEDILFALQMMIMDAFNKFISEQAAVVQGIQQDLNPEDGAGPDDQRRQELQSSLDQEMQALQRLVTKRDTFNQMFQMLLKKYDDSVARIFQNA